jgi:hypothetical protein
MKNIFKKASLIALVISSVFVGCKKDDETVPEETPTPTTTPTNTVTPATSNNLTLKMESYIGSTPLNFSSTFTTNAGAKYTVSMFRYYVSNIRLIKNDGTEYPISNKYLLVTPATINYDLGSVPVGDYKGLKFKIGIDSATNHMDPTVYPASNPLAIQSPAIHWSWSSGYIFMMIEGTCDTTASNTGALSFGQYDRGMFFHIGMDNYYKEVDLSSSAFSVLSTEAKTLSIKSDLNTFFTNVNLKTENQTHTMDNMMLATKAANNIPNMFTVVP